MVRTRGIQILAEGRQYLYPEIEFSCNGTVTKWIYGIKTLSRINDLRRPELQIWRQHHSNHYVKVGSSLINTSNITRYSNVYEFTPETTLQFQKGDVFGLHIPFYNQTHFRLYEQLQSGPKNVYIMASDPLSEINLIFQLRPDTNNFPLVAAEISKIMTMMTYILALTCIDMFV